MYKQSFKLKYRLDHQPPHTKSTEQSHLPGDTTQHSRQIRCTYFSRHNYDPFTANNEEFLPGPVPIKMLPDPAMA